MCAAVDADQNGTHDTIIEEIARVETENQHLRELLQICDASLSMLPPSTESHVKT